jgi:hypothetical protein
MHADAVAAVKLEVARLTNFPAGNADSVEAVSGAAVE